MTRKRKKLDLINYKSGKLTVIAYSHTNGKNNYWICKCECGNISTVKTGCITKQYTQSCGCLNKENRAKGHKKWLENSHRLQYGESSFNWLYLDYKNGALKRNIEFNLDKTIFRKLVTDNCYYCNTSPYSKAKVKTGYGVFIYNGIDRIDSNNGYYINNVVTCCKNCNYAKRSLSIVDFLEWIKKIYKNLNLENNKTILLENIK